MEREKAGAAERQIVGVSLPPEIVADFKRTASEKGLRVRELFLEIWARYRDQQPNPATSTAPVKDRSKKAPRQVLGLSLPVPTAEAFKAEADRRHVSPRRIFLEMWEGERRRQ